MLPSDEDNLLWIRREKWFREFGTEDAPPQPGESPLPMDCVEEFFKTAASKGFEGFIPADLRLRE